LFNYSKCFPCDTAIAIAAVIAALISHPTTGLLELFPKSLAAFSTEQHTNVPSAQPELNPLGLLAQLIIQAVSFSTTRETKRVVPAHQS
jgi:hypothetical protein